MSHVLVLTRSNDQLQLQAYEVVLAAADSAVTLVASQALSPPSDGTGLVAANTPTSLGSQHTHTPPPVPPPQMPQ